jgi:hypothetical protein
LKTSFELFHFSLQAIPILLIVCYVLAQEMFDRVSHHALGKLIAIFLICLYTYKDHLYGAVVCVLVILYYHQQTETFLSKSTTEYAEHLPKSSGKKNTSLPFEDHLEKDFTHMEEAYPNKIKPVKKVNEALFRKEKCHQSKVLYKDQTMKNHMITHVYPELQFQDGECNPCDRTCHFTLEKKQQIEQELAPKNTHTSVLEDIKDFFGISKAEPVVVHEDLVVSEYS